MYANGTNMIFRLICLKCGKHTNDIFSPTNTIEDENTDEETLQRLTREWNAKN